ncbi:MAG: hypothetical protein ABSG05_03545 [Candidatus Pacearchaeota archaeon]|jgi:hypothetical protein
MEDQKLIKIIEQLKEVRTQTKSKVPDETLFDAAVRIYNSEEIENHRQGNKTFSPKVAYPKIHTVFSDSPATSAPIKENIDLATPNQLSALKKMGYDKDTSKLTKYQAWVLIKGGKKSWKTMASS